MLVRFDTGSTDSFDPDRVRDELNPDPQLTKRRRISISDEAAERALRGISISDADSARALGLKTGISITEAEASAAFGQLETGPRVLSSTDFRAALTQANLNLQDAIAKTPAADGFSRFIDLQPIKSSRRANSYRKADELSVTYSWLEAPFDARIVRAVLVLHYEGTVDADTFAEGVRRPRDASRRALVPATGENLRFIGLADEIDDSHGNGDWVNLKARDLTAVLIDTRIPAGFEVKIPPGSTIQTVIRSILDTNDGFDIIRGPFLRTDQPLPQLDSSRYPRLAVTPKERHRAEQTGGRPYAIRYPAKGNKSSYWDVITELCVSHGLRPSIEKDKLVLLEPRTLYRRTPELVTQPGVPTFPRVNGHRWRLGDRDPVRRMVWGDNVENLRFHRKLGKIKAPRVEVVSRNRDAERADLRRVVVLHPPKSSRRVNSVDASGNKPEDKYHTVEVRGIVDKSQLEAIAKQVYEGIGRQELGIAFSTKDLASYGEFPGWDPNEDPDLLDLQAGDPIRLLVTPTQRRSSLLLSLTELNTLVQRASSFAQNSGTVSRRKSAVGFLVGQGWRREDAQQLVRAATSSNLPSEFRVVSASFDFDKGNGFRIGVDARDYVRVRADPEDVSQTRDLSSLARADEEEEEAQTFTLEEEEEVQA